MSAPPDRIPGIRLGTCSWSTNDWIGTIYPEGTKQADFIAVYAQRFSTVEIDSTFYGTPRSATIEGWRDRTPEHFLFSAKAPQVITHEKFLAGCDSDLTEFLTAMSILGPRLGPIVFQFPYYAKSKGVDQREFLNRLKPFLNTLPEREFRFAVEVRNKSWLSAPLLDTLRDHNIITAWIDHPWMHAPEWFASHDEAVTGPSVYIRWLGDRYGIEKITKTWGAHVLDRRKDIERWLPAIRKALEKSPVLGYFNSHYSGYAPGDVGILQDLFARS